MFNLPDCVLWWSLDSLSEATFGSNEHDKIQVKNTIPAIDINVILHVVLFNRICITGLMISSPPPGPVTARPVTIERFLMKYLCNMIKTTKNTQDDPNPYRIPYEKYISVRSGAWDVTTSAVVDMKPPVIAMIRGLNRSDRTPTTGPNSPVEPYAREPTQADKKKKAKQISLHVTTRKVTFRMGFW